MEYLEDKKVLHYLEGKTIREMIAKANELGIERTDVIGIVQGRECYYLVYYYGGN